MWKLQLTLVYSLTSCTCPLLHRYGLQWHVPCLNERLIIVARGVLTLLGTDFNSVGLVPSVPAAVSFSFCFFFLQFFLLWLHYSGKQMKWEWVRFEHSWLMFAEAISFLSVMTAWLDLMVSIGCHGEYGLAMLLITCHCWHAFAYLLGLFAKYLPFTKRHCSVDCNNAWGSPCFVDLVSFHLMIKLISLFDSGHRVRCDPGLDGRLQALSSEDCNAVLKYS